MENLEHQYITSGRAAKLLGAGRITVTRMCRQGKIPAVKISNRWMIPRAVIEELAKTYVPNVGRPRTKRKYTKRSARWFKE